MKLLWGVFLLGHGLMHASYFTPKPDDPNYPFDFTKGWFANLIGPFAQFIGASLAVVTIVSFGVAAMAVIGFPIFESIGKQAAIIGALSSLALLILFWHQWLVLGIAINAIILYGIYRYHWSFGGQ